MLERAYQWTMAVGSRLLFALAAIVFVMAWVGAFVSAAPNTQLSQLNGLVINSFDWRIFFDRLYLVVQAPVLPLIGALIVHHLESRPRS